MIRIVMLAAVILAGPTTARVEEAVTANQLLELFEKISDETMRERLRGVVSQFENGVSWGNVMGKDDGRPPLYCPPNNISLVAEQLVSILREQVKAVPETGESPVEARHDSGAEGDVPLPALNQRRRIFQGYFRNR
jgi:hypothetical protein